MVTISEPTVSNALLQKMVVMYSCLEEYLRMLTGIKDDPNDVLAHSHVTYPAKPLAECLDYITRLKFQFTKIIRICDSISYGGNDYDHGSSELHAKISQGYEISADANKVMRELLPKIDDKRPECEEFTNIWTSLVGAVKHYSLPPRVEFSPSARIDDRWTPVGYR